MTRPLYLSSCGPFTPDAGSPLQAQGSHPAWLAGAGGDQKLCWWPPARPGRAAPVLSPRSCLLNRVSLHGTQSSLLSPPVSSRCDPTPPVVSFLLLPLPPSHSPVLSSVSSLSFPRTQGTRRGHPSRAACFSERRLRPGHSGSLPPPWVWLVWLWAPCGDPHTLQTPVFLFFWRAPSGHPDGFPTARLCWAVHPLSVGASWAGLHLLPPRLFGGTVSSLCSVNPILAAVSRSISISALLVACFFLPPGFSGIELAESRSQFSGALEGGSASSEAQPPP